MKNVYLILAITMCVSISIIAQGIPQHINYQGVLKNSSGVIVPNGNYNIEFFLYEAETGGVVVWQEGKIVNVVDGIINTNIGSVNPLTVSFDKQYWLGIKVESGNELIPRIKFNSVPYSLMSLDVMNESISTNKLQNWAVTTTKISDNSVTSSKIVDGTITALDIGSYEVIKKVNGIKDSVNLIAGSNIVLTPSGNTITISALGGGSGNLNGSGMANYLPKFIGSTTLGNSILFESVSGNIGIGTSSPTAKLELVGGDAKANGLTIGLGSGSINSNTALGVGTLFTNITGMRNTAVGNQALYFNTTGFDNTSVGHQSFYRNTTGNSNTCLGSLSLSFNTTGGSNTSVGASSLLSNTTGINNTAVGTLALFNNVFNSGSTAIGYCAMRYWGSTTGTGNEESECTAVGFESLRGVSGLNNTGMSNTAVGYKSLYSNSDGYLNTAVGVQSLYTNSSGFYNTAFGSYSLYFNTSGSSNTALGHYALHSNTTGISNTASGILALYSNSTGQANTANGGGALRFNTIGNYNVAIGVDALNNNTQGSWNTATGSYVLFSNTTGNNNTAAGSGSLYLNTTGSNNTSNGYTAMYKNTSGSENTAYGNGALYNNTTGFNNTANGFEALYSNTTGNWNTANGLQSLYYNSTGILNCAAGSRALYKNTIGSYNTANGYEALYNSTTGDDNVAVGYQSLYLNSTGMYNTSVGRRANYSNSTGWGITALGYAADVLSENVHNSTVIGYSGVVDASNKVRVGDNAITSIGGQVSWTSFSDGRFKKNLSENVPGLSFINKLKPVTYTVDILTLDAVLKSHSKLNDRQSDKDYILESEELASKTTASQIIYSGFIAQEVEQTAKELGYSFSGVDAPKSDNGVYGLRYAEFVVPLVKAVQEQQKIIEDLTKRIEQLERKN